MCGKHVQDRRQGGDWYDQRWWQERQAELWQTATALWDEAERVSSESGVQYKDRYGQWARPSQEEQPTNLVGMALRRYQEERAEGAWW